MKFKFIALILCLQCISCKQESNNTDQLRPQVNDLEKKIADAYKPGFGEFMDQVQAHHHKLYFAGESENWDLANHELSRIIATLENISKYCTDREEARSIQMIQPAIDNISKVISQKDPASFKNSFTQLTNTCNTCHRSTSHAAIVIKVPDTEPFANQEFKVSVAH